jgi:hypothetical protein
MTDADALFRPLGDLLRLLGGTRGDDEGNARPGADPRRLLEATAEVPLLVLLAGVRTWSRCAEAWLELWLKAVRALGDAQTSPQARAALLDEARAALREVTTLPVQESRRLQAELEALLDRLAAPAPPDASREYWRRWEAKP